MSGDLLSTALERMPGSLDTVSSRVVQRLPDGVKRRLAGPYNRVQTVRANRAFRSRERTARDPGPDAPQHVLCIVVDALRADAVDEHVSPFLAGRTLGPAVTPGTWTFPAVSSLVTGQYPSEHGAMRQSDDAGREATDLVVPPALPAETETLPEVFAGADYRTYGAFAFHMPFFALGGRFEHHALYDDAPATTVLGDYRDWRAAHSEERTFAYLHLGDLHEPVDPPRQYWDRFDVDDTIPRVTQWDYVADPEVDAAGRRYRRHRRRLYDAALASLDAELAELVTDLEARAGDEQALVVTADHGEAFWEHAAFDAARFTDSRPAYCADHGGTPYEAIARVPLVVSGLPGVGSFAPSRPASLVDVAPTLLAALGHPDALSSSGRPLQRGVPDGRVTLVEAARYGYEKKAAYRDGWKLLVSKRDDEAVGFSLPDEEPTDLPPETQATLAEALPAWPDGERTDAAVSGIARQRLEDLGYV